MGYRGDGVPAAVGDWPPKVMLKRSVVYWYIETLTMADRFDIINIF